MQTLQRHSKKCGLSLGKSPCWTVAENPPRTPPALSSCPHTGALDLVRAWLTLDRKVPQSRIPLKIPPRKRVDVPHSCFQDPRSCCLQTTELSDFLQEIQASGASLLFSTVNLATIVTVRGGSNGHGISNLPHLNVTIKLETKLFSNWLENLKNQSIVALTTNSHRFNKCIY